MLYSLRNQWYIVHIWIFLIPPQAKIDKNQQIGCENFLQVSEVSETRERALLKEQKPCHQQCDGTLRGIATHGVHQQTILRGAKEAMTLQWKTLKNYVFVCLVCWRTGGSVSNPINLTQRCDGVLLGALESRVVFETKVIENKYLAQMANTQEIVSYFNLGLQTCHVVIYNTAGAKTGSCHPLTWHHCILQDPWLWWMWSAKCRNNILPPVPSCHRNILALLRYVHIHLPHSAPVCRRSLARRMHAHTINLLYYKNPGTL